MAIANSRVIANMLCGRIPKIRGTRFERRVRKWLESQGWVAFRVAGSLGLVDLVAVKDGATWLIQCKAYDCDHIHKFNPEPLRELALKCGAKPVLVKRVGKRKIVVVAL